LPEINNTHNMRSEVLMVGAMKITVVCTVMPCSLVDVYWHFKGKMANIYHNIQCHILECRAICISIRHRYMNNLKYKCLFKQLSEFCVSF
jgi:hypothetical protein